MAADESAATKNLLANINAIVQAIVGRSWYCGFDSQLYPIDESADSNALMSQIKSGDTHLTFVGYYLGGNRQGPTGKAQWLNKYLDLKSMGWGFGFLYVGEANFVNGDQSRGDQDAAEAIAAAKDAKVPDFATAKSDGAVTGSLIYLDCESTRADQGGRGTDYIEQDYDYIVSWVTGLLKDGSYQPAIYCSRVLVPLIDNRLKQSQNYAQYQQGFDRVKYWVTGGPVPSDDDYVKGVPPVFQSNKDGLAWAYVWQLPPTEYRFAQSTRVKDFSNLFRWISPNEKHAIDRDLSSVPDPSAPLK